jgi:hypothetical protein
LFWRSLLKALIYYYCSGCRKWGPNQTAPKPNSLGREREKEREERDRKNWGPNQTAPKPSSLERERKKGKREREKTGGQIRKLQNQAP